MRRGTNLTKFVTYDNKMTNEKKIISINCHFNICCKLMNLMCHFLFCTPSRQLSVTCSREIIHHLNITRSHGVSFQLAFQFSFLRKENKFNLLSCHRKCFQFQRHGVGILRKNMGMTVASETNCQNFENMSTV